MEHHQGEFEFSIKQIGNHFGNVSIEIPKKYVEELYSKASLAQQFSTHTQGFAKGSTPITYIKSNFQPHLLEHIKEFIFRYFVVNWLYSELTKRKICITSDPRLTDVSLKYGHNALYNFSLTLAQPISLQGWKRLPFKAPKRKNYKDLDRQVENFLKAESDLQKEHESKIINIGDWVSFSVQLLNEKEEALFENYTENLWIKVGLEEADIQSQNLFIGRKKNETFITDSACLQEYFSNHIETHYLFKVKIIDFVADSYFDTELFKKHFRVRNNKELHHKMIEVFSYRNDISQRRATTEDTLSLLLSRHLFEVPNHLILRKQKEILETVQENPDYQVYKMQPDFNDKVKQLAIKQVKEGILVHQLALHEGLTVNNEDLKRYLNLTKRPRMKEFIYFDLPTTKVQGKEFPISTSLLAQTCLREKALNHAIYHLTKGGIHNL